MQILKSNYPRVLWSSILMLLFSSGFCICLKGQAIAAAREYEVKAAFLYNFIQFTEWPAHSFTSSSSPFLIAVLENNPFSEVLQEFTAGESVNGHPLQVRYCSTVAEAEKCHIVFISYMKADKVRQVLTELQQKAVLTIGELPGFAGQGGMIGFFKENNKIRFEINPVEAKAAGLNINSKLLRLARVVETKSR